MDKKQNKRHFFRLAFATPLCADMKIIPLEDVEIEQRSHRVAIVDLSGGGLKFISPVKLADDFQMLLEFRFVLLNKELKLLANLVRRLDEGERFEYSVRFTIDDSEQSNLVQLINTLSIKLKSARTLSSCSFCTEKEISDIFAGSNPSVI
jgi:hypothetical protein